MAEGGSYGKGGILLPIKAPCIRIKLATKNIRESLEYQTLFCYNPSLDNVLSTMEDFYEISDTGNLFHSN